MMKKIVIIDHEPFTIRRKAIFYVDELISRGFEVEFWDCSQWCHAGIKIADELSVSYVKRVDSLEALEKNLDGTDCRHSIFIVEPYNGWSYRKMFKMLERHKCFLVKQEMFATALFEPDYSFFGKLLNTPVQEWIRRGKRFIYSFYRYIYRLRFDLIISSGRIPGRIDIRINHPDWELARQLQTQHSNENEKKYAVFLDEYFPVHPDLKYFLRQNWEKEQEPYRKKLCEFFDFVEKKYDLEVVIAAHPKSEYDEYYWGKRKCYKYRTPELVKNAEMVFMHGSAAISYVIIFNKPLIFLTTNCYRTVKVRDKYMRKLAKSVQLPIFNIDETFDVHSEKISESVRNYYIYNYLTSKGIEDVKNSEILIRTFESIDR